MATSIIPQYLKQYEIIKIIREFTDNMSNFYQTQPAIPPYIKNIKMLCTILEIISYVRWLPYFRGLLESYKTQVSQHNVEFFMSEEFKDGLCSLIKKSTNSLLGSFSDLILEYVLTSFNKTLPTPEELAIIWPFIDSLYKLVELEL